MTRLDAHEMLMQKPKRELADMCIYLAELVTKEAVAQLAAEEVKTNDPDTK